MNITRPHPAARSGERGLATVIVLALLLLMMVFIASNSFTLATLKRDLNRVEQRQLRRYGPALVTNAPPARPGAPAVRR